MFEYKVIPAPRKPVRAKGAKGTTERFAVGLQGLMNELGAEGWSYLRAETLPVDERHGILRKPVEEFHTVLIFARPLADRPQSAQPAADPIPAPAPRSPHLFAEKTPAKASAPALGAATDGGAKTTPEIRAEKQPQPENGGKPGKNRAAKAEK